MGLEPHFFDDPPDIGLSVVASRARSRVDAGTTFPVGRLIKSIADTRTDVASSGLLHVGNSQSPVVPSSSRGANAHPIAATTVKHRHQLGQHHRLITTLDLQITSSPPDTNPRRYQTSIVAHDRRRAVNEIDNMPLSCVCFSHRRQVDSPHLSRDATFSLDEYPPTIRTRPP